MESLVGIAMKDGGDQASKTVLVTGGSGFIGTHLTRRLVSEGASVISLDLNVPRERLEGVRYVTGDVRDLGALQVAKLDRIFNLAAVHTTPGHPDHEYYDTNIGGALEVTKLAVRTGASQIVFTSSISIYGPSEDKKVEATEPAPTSAYGRSKLMAEKIHEQWLNAAPGRRLTVVRPAVVFGAGEGGNFTRMASLLAKGVFIFPGRRDTIKSCIYVEDLLDLILVAAAKPEPYVLFNGSYPECPTLEKIVTLLRDRYFPKARLIDVPSGVVLGAAGMLKAFSHAGLGIHPDRVYKLLWSTYVFPGWAAQEGLLGDDALSSGIERWAVATDGKFV